VGGLHVRGHDPRDFADRILELLGDPALTARLSAGALAHAARFSWEATADEIGRVYLELAGRSAG
jgi:D-inositol-3-phosphate glycosyltransferase